MNILIIGKSGQLANELLATTPNGANVQCLGRTQLDIISASDVLAAFQTFKPSVVINASAYTAVDKAESEPETAYAVNSQAVENIAQACKQVGARLLHVSTDFVFGNNSALTAGGIAPLLPSSPVEPINVYGASKLAGEQHVLKLLPDASVIVRTAWVYSRYGNNFVKTMLRLMAEKPELGVIADQIGTPTWAKGLAQWLWAIVAKADIKGVYHWTDAGAASWYDFAIAIQELGLAKGLLTKEIPIKAIPTASYPTPAKRPGYSVLDKSTAEQAAGISARHWRKQLENMLDEL
ncbi:dTDP-4-dehydrorhamnose reductase [Marinagarivorans cellulosilyticus]|uniref:dTDP-4-dehydrorhamnose reductase n=1 Tax=Marinagarivorans cellulosilyticus TaxID=2721545 RepID=A0AAN1WIU5_9GAMM|nr:dTDP-4-dehydrorhamnose reductase [Marinagarivorans cellulosilyticus]BCD98345.1 dTDP-4-dehydrorhamnose reductase [Marinagarivorans cellulosilyticus]